MVGNCACFSGAAFLKLIAHFGFDLYLCQQGIKCRHNCRPTGVDKLGEEGAYGKNRTLCYRWVVLFHGMEGAVGVDGVITPSTPGQHLAVTACISSSFAKTKIDRHHPQCLWLFLTRTQPPFVQHSMDFRQTKTPACRLAKSSCESNAREWWESVRVFREPPF